MSLANQQNRQLGNITDQKDGQSGKDYDFFCTPRLVTAGQGYSGRN
jgi:hypothetical protein